MKIAQAFGAGILVVLVWASMKARREKVAPESFTPIPDPVLTGPVFRPDLLPGLLGTDKTRQKQSVVTSVLEVPDLSSAARAVFAGSSAE